MDTDQNSLTAGPLGPLLLQDIHLLDKLGKFAVERIPERVVHAKGAGAHGYFQSAPGLTDYTKAKFLQPNMKTEVFVRFSTVAPERGSNDAVRDPRGFAIKFYTDDGIYDLVGLSIPTFQIRDPIKITDLVHATKKRPQSNVPTSQSLWDFAINEQETLNASVHHPSIPHHRRSDTRTDCWYGAVLWTVLRFCARFMYVFSDRGIPNGYGRMDCFGCHTFKWVNAGGTVRYVKLSLTADLNLDGTPSYLTNCQASMKNPDAFTMDLYETIQGGKELTWTAYADILEEADIDSLGFNIFDVTRVWPAADPSKNRINRIEWGKLHLNRNPTNYFQETEQVAFAPSHLVPGIEASNDRLLHGRLFIYPLTQRHRVGNNHLQLPINCPFAMNGAGVPGGRQVLNQQRDGFMTLDNQGSNINYSPNSEKPGPTNPIADPNVKIQPFMVSGEAQRVDTHIAHNDSDLKQPGDLYRGYKPEEQDRMTDNLSTSLQPLPADFIDKVLGVFALIDQDMSQKVRAKLVKAHSLIEALAPHTHKSLPHAKPAGNTDPMSVLGRLSSLRLVPEVEGVHHLSPMLPNELPKEPSSEAFDKTPLTLATAATLLEYSIKQQGAY